MADRADEIGLDPGAREEGRVKDGTVLLLASFGAGLTWASAIVRWRLITRLPINSAALLETRKQEYQDALRLLEQTAAGKFLVEEPAAPAAWRAISSAPCTDDLRATAATPSRSPITPAITNR